MPTARKQSTRNYYKKHPGIWKKNYEKNADARRESSRNYANKKWESDPEYRKNHTENTIRRTRILRLAGSITKSASKALAALEKLFPSVHVPTR